MESQASPQASDQVLLSIIALTYNQFEGLKRLLASVSGLVNPKQIPFELLIVNSGSEERTKRYLDEEARRNKAWLKALQKPLPGESAAVNCGLKACHGGIIALVDDNVILDPGWLEALMDAYQKTDFAAIQGRVLPGPGPGGMPVDAKELMKYNIHVVDFGEHVQEVRGMIGTNMTFRRDVFERVGFFNERLGAGASGYSEDTEYSSRIREAGFRIGYSPFAVVYEQLDPAKYGEAYHRHVHYLKGISRSRYQRHSIIFNTLPNLFANGIRYLFYRLSGSHEKAYETIGRIMKYWGYLIGRLRKI